MRVLQINETFAGGGAGLISRHLARALAPEGFQCSGLQAPTRPGDTFATPMPQATLAERIYAQAQRWRGRNDKGWPRSGRLLEHPLVREADLIHLHNLHGYYFDIRWLPLLCARKPVVWTWHDMWPVTGHCAHAFDCGRWHSGCGSCPYPETFPAVRVDRTAEEWQDRRHAIAASHRLEIICPGQWGLAQARELLPALRTHHIPNPVRLKFPETTSSRLEFPEAVGRCILLVVADSMKNPFKNMAYLISELEHMPPEMQKRLALRTVGKPLPGLESSFPLPVQQLGEVTHPEALSRVYLDSDLFACPSRAETQPLVLLEAMAAGLGCVATGVGGIPELLEGDRGVLIPGAPGDLASALEKLIRDPALRERLGSAARSYVSEHHATAHIANLHARLYRRMVEEWTPPGS